MNPIMLSTGEIRFDTFLEKSAGNSVDHPWWWWWWGEGGGHGSGFGCSAQRQRRDPTSSVSTGVANLNDGPVCGDAPVILAVGVEARIRLEDLLACY